MFIFNLYFLILSFLNISKIFLNDSIVLLPLIKRDKTFLNNLKNITEIMQFIFSEPPLAELNLGSKGQKAHIIIRPEYSNIYFTSFHHNLSASDQTSKIIKNKYPNINYFNEKISESIEYNEARSQSNFYYNFNEWKIVSENFENIKLNFSLATSIEVEESGSLGLQKVEITSILQYTPSFLYQLRLKNKITNYKWFIYYGEENEKDYLVIGCSPHEFFVPDTGKQLFPNIDIYNDYYNIGDKLYLGKCLMKIEFDEIYITSNITNLKRDESFQEHYTNGFLKVNIGFIIGSLEYEKYLKNIYFKNYLDNNKCYYENFIQRTDFNTLEYSYFYCDYSIYEDIKNSFRPLVFKKALLYENFVLSFNDLFLEKNGFLIFLVIFTNNYNNWNLGNPFLRKYQFVYDFGNKQIGYYHDRLRKEKNYDEDKDGNGFNNEKNNNRKQFLVYIGYSIVIIIWASLLILLGFLLGKKVNNARKKRANELNDDFEYKETFNSLI